VQHSRHREGDNHERLKDPVLRVEIFAEAVTVERIAMALRASPVSHGAAAAPLPPLARRRMARGVVVAMASTINR